jgi:hypothetical protein
MKKYLIKTYETVISHYEINAESATEALMSFRLDDSGDFVHQENEQSISNNEIGLSFEVLPVELNIDTDMIQQEFNEERNNEYIESIHSIEEIK